MGKVVILRGPSGSGKSTAAYKMHGHVVVVSADDFFLVGGTYIFDPRMLTAAHAACMRRFVEACQEACLDSVVVVDNTNTSLWEISPYVLVAQAYGLDPEIVEVESSLPDEDLAARNTHGVGVSAIAGQRKRIAENPLLPWWKSSKVSQ